MRHDRTETAEPHHLLTVHEAAEYLRVCQRSVYRWLRTGRLRGYRAGGRWRIPREALDAWLVSRRRLCPHSSDPAEILRRLDASCEENRVLLGRELSTAEVVRLIHEGRRDYADDLR